MMKYVYPAIFAQEESGLYAISFPDLEGCYTSGSDMIDGYRMAEDVLCYCLYDIEREGGAAPAPSNPAAITPQGPGFVAMVACDTNTYRMTARKKSVKKTLSVPQWLDEMAVGAGLNFSHVLQEGLKKELNIE
jgi:predicted RNase H-like HicB family nuclease